MLYMLNQDEESTTFVRLIPTTLQDLGRREKDMERWLSENPHAVLPESERGFVFSDEQSFENLADILAVDPEGSILVVELKRGRTPRDVIAQALEYVSDVAGWDYSQLNTRAVAYFSKRGLPYQSLLEAFQDVFSLPAGEFDESMFNRKQRIFVVAEVVDSKVERTARWLLHRGVEITCVQFECFRAGDHQLFIDFTEVVRSEETLASGAGSSVRTKSVNVSEAEVVDGLLGPVRDLYIELKRRAERFGNDVETGATSGYLRFTAGRNFAEIHPQRERIRINLRPEGFQLSPGESGFVDGIDVRRVPDRFLWTLNHEIVVHPTTDLQVVEALLRRSYDAVH